MKCPCLEHDDTMKTKIATGAAVSIKQLSRVGLAHNMCPRAMVEMLVLVIGEMLEPEHMPALVCRINLNQQTKH